MILLIGYGNLLCGDDGIGPYVVDQLADADLRGDLEYISVRQLTPELAEPISRAEAVIFVDAAYGDTTGEIFCRALEFDATSSQTGAFTHHFDASRLLESAQFLYNHHPEAYLYTMTGENFRLGDSFSSVVAAALPSLMDQVKARIAQCMNLVSLKQ